MTRRGSRRRGERLAWGVALAVAFTSNPGRARADAVDEAYRAGNAAAEAGHWERAVAEYERALAILPGESAVLSYDLGTAHAHLGHLGPATFHLRRALEANPDPAVREAARRNLGIVRRRMEIQAKVRNAQVSPPDDWRDRARTALAAPWLGLLGLALGALLVVLLIARRFTPPGGRARTTIRSLALASAASFVLISLVHGLASWSDAGLEVIVLPEVVEVREGPGTHREVAFSLQGGSSALALEQASGWTKIRVEGGLVGWVRDESLGHFDRLEPSGSGSGGGPARAR